MTTFEYSAIVFGMFVVTFGTRFGLFARAHKEVCPGGRAERHYRADDRHARKRAVPLDCKPLGDRCTRRISCRYLATAAAAHDCEWRGRIFPGEVFYLLRIGQRTHEENHYRHHSGFYR